MKKILVSPNHLMSELFQTKLEESGIPVLVIDKTDSAYVMLGHQELYVRAEDFEDAKQLLIEFKQNNEIPNDDITD